MSQNYSILSKDLKQKFKDIVGNDSFFDQKEIRWTYAFGGTVFEKEWIPDLILLPRNREQIKKILKLANQKKIPITPRGSGTSLSGGAMTPYGGIVLDVSRMNNILDLNIENNIVEVEPGVICDDLNEDLQKYGYFFPPDPGSSSVATIGGMVANNAGGIQAFKYGVTKQYVMYLEVILANGKIINFGTDVLKSVAAYNLKDLFIGSEGTLGVITKIGLRIRPLPTHRKLGLFIFDEVKDLENAVCDIRREGIIPNLLEFMDKVILGAVREYLGGEFYDFPEGYVLLAEMDGNTQDHVEDDFTQIFDVIIQHNPKFYRIAKNDRERERLIQARKANLPALSRIKPTTCVEDCTISLTQFADVIKKIEQIPEEIGANNLKIAIICHMEGNLHPTFLFNENNPKDVEDFEEAIDYLYRKIIIPIGGSITGEHGIGKIKTPYLELSHGKKITEKMHQIKQIFDPNMILNPGVGKGDTRKLEKADKTRQLKNQNEKVLELACMRCGFCIASCPSRKNYKIEAYSPRGRLSILNGLVYGEIELTQLVNDILHTCSLCALCREKCPSGVPTLKIIEQAREIIHKNE
ncbi:MAG: FAD-binding protein [Candidatus Lokiarchaeota archaeon]|nr:FAD-binding protein [Candidatus Lokiarchaeota archaeon]